MDKILKKRKIKVREIAIIVLTLIIMVCIIIICKPQKIITPAGIEVVNTGVREDTEISEKNAKKVAVKQFKKLGEKSVKEKEITILKIKREDEYYYYLTSKQNTMEIKILGGKVTRINSATVAE